MRYVITCVVTRNTLLPLVVLVCPLLVLSYPPVVLVYLLVVPVCPLVALVVLSVGLFITDPINRCIYSTNASFHANKEHGLKLAIRVLQLIFLSLY